MYALTGGTLRGGRVSLPQQPELAQRMNDAASGV